MNSKQTSTNQPAFFSDSLWDLWCIASVVGIWPRFIEPQMVSVSQLAISFPDLPPELEGLKILQFSDLHLHDHVKDHFLNKIVKQIQKLAPDIIVFTGDFLCYSILDDEERLLQFFNRLHAPYGCYAVLGNHDYSECVSINSNGDYDVLQKDASTIGRGFSRLFTTTQLTKTITTRARAVTDHAGLINLIKKTPFTLLDNRHQLLSIKGSKINLCGLGEYTLGKTKPELAFQGYDTRYPGIILLHNPDGVLLLKDYPGDIILCGHTHGGQVNLPWMWKKFTLLENMQFKKGLHQVENKWVYINRGVGSVMPFRWFSPPELLLLTLKGVYGNTTS